MRIEVRYFAAAREAAGRESEAIDLPDGGAVSDLARALLERHPALERLHEHLRYAVGDQFAAANAPLANGDLVALIPPVSGG